MILWRQECWVETTYNRQRKFIDFSLTDHRFTVAFLADNQTHLSTFVETTVKPASKSSSGGNNNTPAAIAENAMRVATTGIGELDVPTMKKYIQYAKAKCAPRLSEEAGDILASSYVKIRDDVRKRVMEVSVTIVSYPVYHVNQITF